ncbi:hypothetical protein CJ20_109 [Escherichia phage CJ20]|nr:hypothetical protein CJ20_109 [Escherichia phage CJ20]
MDGMHLDINDKSVNDFSQRNEFNIIFALVSFVDIIAQCSQVVDKSRRHILPYQFLKLFISFFFNFMVFVIHNVLPRRLRVLERI